MGLNPWEGRTLKSVLGFCIINISLSLPLIFVFFVYRLALQGNIYMIVVSVLQIYFQYIHPIKKNEMILRYGRWIRYEKYFQVFTFESLDGPIHQTESLFAIHPHNIFTYGMVFNYYLDRFGKTASLLATRSLLQLPGLGLIHKLSGIQGVDAPNVKRLMKLRQNIVMIPGGFEEATLSCQKEQRVFIKSRKGFIKYAIRNGYRIYPTFIFGENKVYYTMERFLSFRLALNKLKMVGVLFWSRFGPFFPECWAEIHTVVGNPLTFPQCQHPTIDLVNKCHAEYIQALKDLYYSNREKYHETSELHIY